MSRTVTISDEVYEQLEKTAHERGLESVEQLLEQWPTTETLFMSRREVVCGIDALRQEFFSRYGEMPDSTALLCEDRMR